MFKVPEFDTSNPEFRFDFTTPDGKTYSVPKLQYVPLPLMEAAGKRGGLGIVDLLNEIDPKIAAVVAGLSPAQMQAIDKAWTAESSANVGESSASAS